MMSTANAQFAFEPGIAVRNNLFHEAVKTTEILADDSRLFCFQGSWLERNEVAHFVNRPNITQMLH